MIHASKGRIILSSVSNARKVTADEYWLITRGGRTLPGFKRVKDLAPEPPLFRIYLTKWKGTPAESWWPEYREWFNAQLENEVAKRYLRLLWRLTEAGRDILLACYCKNETYCHRSLVGEHLARHGVEIVSFSGVDMKNLNSNYATALRTATDVQQLSLF